MKRSAQMKHVDILELERTGQPIPIKVAVLLNTRKERLTYLAKLVAEKGSDPMELFHDLEYHSKEGLDRYRISEMPSYGYGESLFRLAEGDPNLKAGGIGETVGSLMDYFQLSNAELHEFSCDCG